MPVIIILVGISVICLIAEACYIMPDKMPWNKRRDGKHGKR